MDRLEQSLSGNEIDGKDSHLRADLTHSEQVPDLGRTAIRVCAANPNEVCVFSLIRNIGKQACSSITLDVKTRGYLLSDEFEPSLESAVRTHRDYFRELLFKVQSVQRILNLCQAPSVRTISDRMAELAQKVAAIEKNANVAIGADEEKRAIWGKEVCAEQIPVIASSISSLFDEAIKLCREGLPCEVQVNLPNKTNTGRAQTCHP